MKSFSRRRHSQPYVQAEALVDARNKVFNVIMAVLFGIYHATYYCVYV